MERGLCGLNGIAIVSTNNLVETGPVPILLLSTMAPTVTEMSMIT